MSKRELGVNTHMKIEIVNRLVNDFPELREEVESNVKDFGDIYLHLIFGDIFNPYLLNLLDDPEGNRSALEKASRLIGDMLRMDVYIQETAVTTVLERLSDIPSKIDVFNRFMRGAAKNS